MFNLKEFIINNLVKGVKNKSFSKEYASILATNYLIKGILNEEDIMRFDTETTEELTDNETVENVEEVTEENEEVDSTEEVVENTEATEVAEGE